MKAVLMSETGSVDVLRHVDVAEPLITKAAELKVQLKAAGVNPIDTKIRKNGAFFPDGLPLIPGCDGAGVVIETGSGVCRFRPGDRVWFCDGGLGGDQGNYAEFKVLDERWVAPMPKSLDFVTAAAGPLALITAWGMLYDRGRLRAGQTVLIHAGAGGVGHIALQLAKLRKAKVLTTVGSAGNEKLALELGADVVINHLEQDFVKEVNRLTDGLGADLVLEMVNREVFLKSLECTACFGDLVTLLDPGEVSLKEARARNLRIGFEFMLAPQIRHLEAARLHQVRILRDAARLIDEGLLRIHVSQVFGLADAALAHTQIESGKTTGKVVLEIV